MPTEAKCKDRIKAEYADTIKTVRKLWKLEQTEPDASDPDYGRFCEYGLGFDYVAPGTFNGQRRGYFRWQLSWGGPSEEFRFFCDENAQPVRVEYWFLDWFDGARRTLRGNDREMLVNIFDYLTGGDAAYMIRRNDD